MPIINKTNQVFPRERILAYRAVLTQTGAGGGNNVFTITPLAGNRMKLLWLKAGADDYAAARTVQAYIYDEDDGQQYILGSNALDNAVWLFPSSITENLSTRALQSLDFIIAGDDYLRVHANSLVQNETFTLTFRIMFTNAPPVVQTSDSTGTVSNNVTIEEIY